MCAKCHLRSVSISTTLSFGRRKRQGLTLAVDPGGSLLTLAVSLWKRDFTGAGGLFGVELKPVSRERLAAMLDGYTHFKLGYSWGGYESLVIQAHLERSVAPLPEGPLVRFQVGLEDVEDLRGDLERGFMRIM